jgi:hypothetical protein
VKEIETIGSSETAPALSSRANMEGARRGRDNKASLESSFRWVRQAALRYKRIPALGECEP